MKTFVAIFALVAVAAADVSHLNVRGPDADAQILENDSDVGPDSFSFSYKTSNGIGGQANGGLKSFGPNDAALVSSGVNSYTAPNGQLIETTYTADENGYHPQGDHLPTPPAPQPIPDYILRSLEYNAAHAPQPETLRRV